MGNVQSAEEFEAAQKAAREQGRQEMLKKLEGFDKARSARERQQAQADLQTALEDGEVIETPGRDSGADENAEINVKNEKTAETVITIKREPNDTSDQRAKGKANGRANERAAEQVDVAECQGSSEQALAAARKQSTSQNEVQNPLTQWNPRKQPRQKDAAKTTPLVISSAVESRNKSTEVTDPRSPKRIAPESGFGDERRPDGPGKKHRSSLSVLQSPSDTSECRQPPEWYRQMKFDGSRSKQESEADPLLVGLKNQIKKAQEVKKAQDQQKTGRQDAFNSRFQEAFNEARDRLHKIAFVQVTKKALRNSRILDNQNGLPQVFDPLYAGGVSWPFDIKADAEELYNKWSRKDFETDLMRGIICGKPSLKSGKEKNDRTSDKLRDDWPRRGANYTGHGKLLNGQWWPTQLTCLRDDAHGSSQAGVSGGSIKKGEGAYSCVMSGGHGYGDDKDNGDQVYYCGTDSNNGEITDATQLLLNSVGQTVRLIRSHQLQSEWAPVIGFRYDGLYEVQDFKRIDPEGHPRARHRFTLVRVPGQDPIRGGDGPERRPTQQEVDAYKKDKRLRGF